MAKNFFALILAFAVCLSGSQAVCEEIFDLNVFSADLEIRGTYPYHFLLGNVVAAGDINGDGFDDIVAVGQCNPSVFILYGHAALGGGICIPADSVDVRIAVYMYNGIYTYPSPKASFGDMNGDGIEDLIFPTEWHTLVLHGSSSLPPWIDEGTYPGLVTFVNTKGACGPPAVGTGDFDGDGFDDLLMSRCYWMPPDAENSVQARVVLGEEEWPPSIDLDVTPPDVEVNARSFDLYCHSSVSPADINNDGFDDIIFSCMKYHMIGAVWAIFGATNLPAWLNLDSTLADLNIYGAGYYFGAGVAAGDINGDSLNDLVVSSPLSKTAHILYGDTLLPQVIDLWDTTASVLIQAPDYSSSTFGIVVATGDFNHDGHADMLFGAGHRAGVGEEAYLVLGGENLPSAIYLDSGYVGITVIGRQDTFDLGSDVAMGDFNGDGLDDLLMGATSGGPSKIYVILGSDTVNHGDVNYDKIIDLADAVFLLNYLFRSGPQPYPLLAGDTNCDEMVDLGDVVYLLNYLFKSGPEPGCPQ